MAELLVTNLNDDGSEGSLRNILATANGNGEFDTITFDSSLEGTITLASGQLEITEGVSINGGGKITIDGADASRIFLIDDGTAAVINAGLTGLTLQNGKSDGTSTADRGGAIYSTESLTITDSSILNNEAAGASNDAGAIYLDSSGGTLTIRNSIITGNSAEGDAGAIRINNGTLAVEDTLIRGNTAGNNFDSIQLNGGTGSALRSTIFGTRSAELVDTDTTNLFDDDANAALPTVSVSIDPTAGTEGDGNDITLTISTNETKGVGKTVDLAASGTGITASDFDTAIPTTVTLDNAEASETVVFKLNSDGEVEAAETATFIISSPTEGATVGTASVDLAIADDG